VSECSTEFFLTGGTAINRGFYNRRYSDDLDFFLSGDKSFAKQMESVLSGLEKSGFMIDNSANALRTSDFCTFKVIEKGNSEVGLKLDFVNDVAVHFDGFVSTHVFPKTDSPRNMLSNKITALFRFEAKDVADIHTLCANLEFSWQEIIEEARQKEAGMEAPIAAEILTGIPEDDFRSIKWIEQPSWDVFRRDLGRIAEDLIRGGSNSCCTH
jgi:hypothetical protein